jgi:hypothetical protein
VFMVRLVAQMGMDLVVNGDIEGQECSTWPF